MSDKEIAQIFSENPEGMSAEYWAQQYRIAKWAIDESDRLHRAELSALRARVAEFEQRREFDAGVIDGLNVAIKIKDERIAELELSAANGTEIMWQNAKLTKRVAELEAAQSATLTPRKCGTCQQAAEQMREAAANMCQDLANRTEIFSGAIDTKRNREARAEHKIYSNLVIYIRSLPLPTCCDCNPLAPSSAVDELHGVKCECWCECDNYASRNLKGVLLCDKCADD